LTTIVAGVDTGFAGPEAYSILGTFLKKNNTKLGTKVNVCLELVPRPWKGPVQLRGPCSLSFISFMVYPPPE